MSNPLSPSVDDKVFILLKMLILLTTALSNPLFSQYPDVHSVAKVYCHIHHDWGDSVAQVSSV